MRLPKRYKKGDIGFNTHVTIGNDIVQCDFDVLAFNGFAIITGISEYGHEVRTKVIYRHRGYISAFDPAKRRRPDKIPGRTKTSAAAYNAYMEHVLEEITRLIKRQKSFYDNLPDGVILPTF